MTVQDSDFTEVRLSDPGLSQYTNSFIEISSGVTRVASLTAGELNVITTYTDGTPKSYYPGPTTLQKITGVLLAGKLRFDLSPALNLPNSPGAGFTSMRFNYKIYFKTKGGKSCYRNLSFVETFGS